MSVLVDSVADGGLLLCDVYKTAGGTVSITVRRLKSVSAGGGRRVDRTSHNTSTLTTLTTGHAAPEGEL